MAEKKKGKRRKEEYIGPGDEVIVKPSKEEYAIAKWLRNNVPIKKTKFLNHNVQYFTACKAVDALWSSKWSQGEGALFKSREAIVGFLNGMLDHKFFHRARKVPVSEQELTKQRKGKDKKAISEKKEDRIEEVQKEVKEKVTDAESSVAEIKKDDGSVEKDKRKRKIRLDMHNDQRFVDGLDAYVWLYDPIPFYYWIIGTLVVLAAIGICMFPLWPPTVRLVVYYLSLAAAGFLVVIIVLIILRLIIFCLIWITTLGKHHFWILPNLTEDVGFFASFWPLYMYVYKGPPVNNKKKEKDSDAEDDSHENATESDKLLEKKTSKKIYDSQSTHTANGNHAEDGGGSESESSQRSSTGKDFEMVDQLDLDC